MIPFCYYSDIDNSIYQVSEDTVTLRYYLDKGSFKKTFVYAERLGIQIIV